MIGTLVCPEREVFAVVVRYLTTNGFWLGAIHITTQQRRGITTSRHDIVAQCAIRNVAESPSRSSLGIDG
jgi:hypothetical protein